MSLLQHVKPKHTPLNFSDLQLYLSSVSSASAPSSGSNSSINSLLKQAKLGSLTINAPNIQPYSWSQEFNLGFQSSKNNGNRLHHYSAFCLLWISTHLAPFQKLATNTWPSDFTHPLSGREASWLGHNSQLELLDPAYRPFPFLVGHCCTKWHHFHNIHLDKKIYIDNLFY